MVKTVLENIQVYWMAIAKISKGILDKTIKKCFDLLWTRKRAKECISLVKWERLATP